MDDEKNTIEMLRAMKDKLDAIDITDTIITCINPQTRIMLLEEFQDRLDIDNLFIILDTLIDDYSISDILQKIKDKEKMKDLLSKYSESYTKEEIVEILCNMGNYPDVVVSIIIDMQERLTDDEINLIEKAVKNIIFLEESNESTDVDEIVSILLRLYKNNNDVLENIDLRLLHHKYIDTLGEERINLISCYPDIQDKILRLSDKQLYLFDKCIDVYVEQNQTDEWTPLASNLLGHIAEYATLIENLENIKNLNKEDITNIARIMQSENWCGIYSIDEVRNYDIIKAEKCKSIMQDKYATLEQKKQAVYQKIFGHDLSYAKQMIKKYGEDIENIDDCEVKDYIRAIKIIDKTDNIEVLQDIFENCDYAELDKALAERALKTEYGKKYFEDLYVPQEKDRVDKTSNIYEAGTEFKIILTSISAYIGNNDKDNYKTDWNRPAISTQHFCASYIRNDMIAVAGMSCICYGFSKMKEDALMLSGPTDIYSSKDQFESTAEVHETYYTPDVQINNTSEYNEMDFRRIQGGVKKQPDYIVVFRRFGQIKNLEEAQRASEQWGGMPIVVVDIDECLRNEREKILGGEDVEGLLPQYRKNPTPELAREIIQKVRNNRETDSDFCSDIEDELEQIRAKVDVQETEQKEAQIQIEKEPEVELVDEHQLAENHEIVSAKEREDGKAKISRIYRKIKDITRGGKEDGR